jgi:hypothetical protein
LFRNDKIREFTIKLVASPLPGYRIAKVVDPTELQKQIYRGWLRTPWEGSAVQKSNSH